MLTLMFACPPFVSFLPPWSEYPGLLNNPLRFLPNSTDPASTWSGTAQGGGRLHRGDGGLAGDARDIYDCAYAVLLSRKAEDPFPGWAGLWRDIKVSATEEPHHTAPPRDRQNIAIGTGMSELGMRHCDQGCSLAAKM